MACTLFPDFGEDTYYAGAKRVRVTMEIIETEIADVKMLKPKVFQDARGFFMETFSEQRYREAGIGCHFV